MNDDYDSFYDYDNDGKLDDYETFMKEEDDDQFYYENYGNGSNPSSSYRSSTNTSRSNSGGFSFWKSYIVGLIATVCIYTLLGAEITDSSLIVWAVITFVIYKATNAT